MKWKAEARRWILKHVAPGSTFSGNDLWKAGLPPVDNRRLLGSVLLSMEIKGEVTRAPVLTDSIGGHGQPIRVWQRADDELPALQCDGCGLTSRGLVRVDSPLWCREVDLCADCRVRHDEAAQCRRRAVSHSQAPRGLKSEGQG